MDAKNLISVTYENTPTLHTIFNAAFIRNSTLPSIFIPNTVAYIGAQCFNNCIKLTNVTFEPGIQLKIIQGGSFCLSGLTSITIPASVTEIQAYAFAQSIIDPDKNTSSHSVPSTIADIIFEGDKPIISPSAFYGINYLIVRYNTLKKNWVPDFAVSPTRINNIHSDFINFSIIPVDVNSDILPSVYYNIINFNTISLIYNVFSSGIINFNMGITGICTAESSTSSTNTVLSPNILGKVKSILFPFQISYIGSYAFVNAYNLTSITFTGNSPQVLLIGNNAFQNTGLTSVNIPDSVRTIGELCFANCSKLSSLIFNENRYTSRISSIPSKFAYLSPLISIKLPQLLTYIGPYAFAQANIYTSDGINFTLQNNEFIPSIGTEIIFAGGKPNIDPSAFYGINNLQIKYYSGNASSWETNGSPTPIYNKGYLNNTITDYTIIPTVIN